MRHLLYAFLGITTVCYAAWGQDVSEGADTAANGRVLPEVTVEAPRLEAFSAGHKVVALTEGVREATAAQSMADLLAQQSSVFVKNYGPGQLASLSVRGTGASHTAVLWNGFPLNSPMLGQLDLSLVPVALTDEVDLQYGGGGALFGSGALGGSLHLRNQPHFGRGVSVGTRTTLGSFGYQHHTAEATVSHQRWSTSLKLLHQRAENNFPIPGTERRQPHARLRQTHLLLDNYLRIQTNQLLSLRLWSGQSDRDLPPVRGQERSVAEQDDGFLRLSAEWQQQGERMQWQVRSAWFHERLDYQDSVAGTDSRSRSQSATTEAEGTMRIGERGEWNLGVNHNYTRATTASYGPEAPQRHRTAGFTSFRYKTDPWDVVASLREERYGAGQWTPLVPSLGATWHHFESWMLRGNVTRVYRIPTFNDLFWQPGGNPDLRPENGWSGELGTHLTKAWLGWQGELDLTGFSHHIEDWILWLPQRGGYWTPVNVRRVWSRGLEAEGALQRAWGDWQAKLSGSYHYTRSTNRNATSESDYSQGKQLIYVPLHQASGQFRVDYRAWKLGGLYQFTGYRYITSDNSAFLPGYGTSHVWASWAWRYHSLRGHVSGRIDNLWNQAYEVVEARPMPGRSAQLGLTIYFTH
ncbi:iron complex outermembrane recepter protein [Catalinimonas alkaloidigena]|uniref:Iron complex outermembrane recepter protein n=1 Tax=Catalinimonas alkaloidigena TaxID=1075417 RepID=A0A1G8XZL4_9BACT|nr:TonB-dependent receptor [Catalinimonas alkaloidigena]SDJ95988.1 iron complex outermembrane recepter protein [Catalinimonas alkaloidigena]